MEIKLKSNQQQIVNENKLKCGNWQGCGSGKTLAHLCLAEGNTMVITPKNLYEQGRWYEERDKFGMDDITIKQVSKEVLKVKAKTAMLPQVDTVIIDEAHHVFGWYINNKRSNTLENLMRYLANNPPKRLYLLTATPIGNSDPLKLYAIARILGHNWDFEKFRDKYYWSFKIPGQWGKRYKKRDTPELRQRLQELLRQFGYTGSILDFEDVPEQTEIVKYFGMTSNQKKQLRESDKALHRSIENGRLFHKEIKQVGAEEQLVYHPYYEKTEKDEYILELAQQFDKFVVYANYTLQVEGITQMLRDNGYTVLTLTGKTKDRTPFTKDGEANTLDKCICVIQSAISDGYDLNTYRVRVNASFSNKSRDFIQIKGRNLRTDNLQKNLGIALVVKGGRDEECYNSIIKNVDFTEKALSAQIVGDE